MAGRCHATRLAAAMALATLAFVSSVGMTPASAAVRPSFFVGLTNFDGRYTIQSDGTVEATEVLDARFSGNDSHGVYRTITTEQDYTPKPNTTRRYEISNIRVSADPGIPARFTTTQTGGDLKIRIGDPHITVPAGDHTYTLSYTITGALNHFSDHDEFYWNVTGSGWNRIDHVAISERGPAAFTNVACYAGPTGANRRCTSATIDATGGASFTNGALTGGEVTTVVALPTGVITPVPEPILETKPSATRIPPAIALTLGGIEFVVLASGIILFVVVRGRDRQSTGSAIDQAFAGAPGDEGVRVPIGQRREIPVEFVPPDKLRPGLIGILVDEEASTLDVTATIVDLACRGYLRIVELPGGAGLFGSSTDWRIDRMRQDVDGLEPYEVTLINALFTSNTNTVNLSDLKNTFAASMRRIKYSLTSGAMKRGWFRRDPNKSAQGARSLAAVMIVLGMVGTIASVLAYFAAPLVLAGLLLFVLSRYLPARTPVGTAAYRRALGFKRFITESEKYRAQYAERANLFTEYLPYAVVFGCTTKWAETLKDLGLVPAEAPSWYFSSSPFNIMAFSSALSSFASTSASAMTSTPGGSGMSGFSGGGGFAGGGGGGGGGGGW